MDSSEEYEEEWKEVGRQRKNQDRKQERKIKRKTIMEEIATRMKHMVGVGPIPKASVDYFEEST